jgi:AraC-like DNA-binding protein
MTPRTTLIDTQDINHWVDAIWATYAVQRVLPQEGEAFSASLAQRDFDLLRTIELRTTPQTFQRTPGLVSSHPDHELIICLVVEGEAFGQQDGRDYVMGQGEFTVVESSRPYTVGFRGSCTAIDFAWPRSAIGLSEDESRALTGQTFGADSRIGRWLSPVLLDIAGLADPLPDASAIHLASGLADLLVAAALEAQRTDPVNARQRRLYEAMTRYLETHLEDGDLSPRALAEAFFVSTRTVHRLFAGFDTTVTAEIRDQRLEACRRMMLSAGHRDRSLGAISSQVGFSSLPVFSRAFAAKYGVPPTRYRREAQS